MSSQQQAVAGASVVKYVFNDQHGHRAQIEGAVFGHTPAKLVYDYLGGVGTPDADVVVTFDALFASEEKTYPIHIRVSSPLHSASLYLEKPSIHLQSLEVKVEGDRARGLGRRIFTRVATTALACGFTRIYGLATRVSNPQKPENAANGYYSAPRWGFDGELADAIRQQLPAFPPGLEGVGRLSELMHVDVGRKF